jgi:hypothetical protein
MDVALCKKFRHFRHFNFDPPNPWLTALRKSFMYPKMLILIDVKARLIAQLAHYFQTIDLPMQLLSAISTRSLRSKRPNVAKAGGVDVHLSFFPGTRYIYQLSGWSLDQNGSSVRVALLRTTKNS